VSDAAETLGARVDHPGQSPRLLSIFAAGKLHAYGYAFAVVYAVLMLRLYINGAWLVDGKGVPVYTDFTCAWVAGLQALHGEIASLYDPAKFLKIQAALAVSKTSFYLTWPYPPTFFLILAPFALLPYVAAFFTWNILTLLGCIAAVYCIVRRLPAIALVLASPFSAWNFFGGQNGFLTASFLGTALLLLERRPVLAGVFIGCLTYKPHFGILLPVALVASRQWRAFVSAVATAAVLSGASIAAFGTAVWDAFPQELIAHTNGILLSDPGTDPRDYWGHLQTVYGVVRYLGGGTVLAWLAQGITTFTLVVIVWLVWRSPVRYALKAATLSAAVLIATPYAYAYDMAVIAIPVAFLASDQIGGKLLRGEQTIMIALFGASLLIFLTLGKTPLGPLITLTLLGVILRRTFYNGRDAAVSDKGASGQLRRWLHNLALLRVVADRSRIPISGE
jgi:arabinofuranan 3-O-arabinosyltransferase